ncbi:UNVERIFIED_CONTAM: hypothetical protein HDU68_012651 [Siphonaria sp. JEL0065]|nr:hypothetical protein HDU68_012651 [Siphonaria sp. JEL0065]
MLLTAIGLITHELFVHPSERTDELELELTSLLDRVTLDMLKIELSLSSPIEYYNIYECNDFNFGAFVIRKGQTMPIHDHPNMTVFTKLIHGDLHVKELQLLDAEDDSARLRRARVVSDKICSGGNSSNTPSTLRHSKESDSAISHPPSPTLTHRSDHTCHETVFKIFPTDGPNLHSYTAVSDYAVILDVMGPPYAAGERDITYYSEVQPTEVPQQPLNAATTGSPISKLQQQQSTPNSVSYKRKREDISLDDFEDLNTSIYAKKSNLSSMVFVSDGLVSPAESASQLFRSTSSLIRENHCNPSPAPETITYLKVDPSVEMEVNEARYEGLPVRDFLKLMEKSRSKSGNERVGDALKISDRIGRTIDKITNGSSFVQA